MEIQNQELLTKATKLFLSNEGKQIARVIVYLIKNESHNNPYALIEDLFVNEEYRKQGYGKQLMLAAIEEAKKQKCTWIIANSRYSREYVHQFYQKLGFEDYGKEFKMVLKSD
jgi:GNAT superfamily N-acetyltransferase